MSGHWSRDVVETRDDGAKRTVGEKAQRVRHDNRIFEAALIDIGLSDERELGVRATLEFALHRGERRSLELRDELALTISSREELENARRQACDNGDAQRPLGRVHVLRDEQPVRRYRGHDKPAGHDGGAHRVGVLQSAHGLNT